MSDRKTPDKHEMLFGGLYPEFEFRPLRSKIRKTEILAEIVERQKSGASQPGDWSKAAKLMLSFSKRELVGLILDLSIKDEPSFYPYVLDLKRRSSGALERARQKAANKHARKKANEQRQQDTVARIALLQEVTDAKVTEAYETLAEGKAYSAEKVKRDYMGGIKVARKRGHALLQPPNHMIEPIKVPVNEKSPKGRRPKKG